MPPSARGTSVRAAAAGLRRREHREGDLGHHQVDVQVAFIIDAGSSAAAGYNGQTGPAAPPPAFAPAQIGKDGSDESIRSALLVRRRPAAPAPPRPRPGGGFRRAHARRPRAHPPDRAGQRAARPRRPRPGDRRACRPRTAAPIPWSVAETDKIRGDRLRLELPAGTSAVEITYRTSPGALALGWLDPPQTAGGVHPFMFSQCQAIHARTIVPCQDTPRHRVSYDAAITVPAPLRAVMSAAPRRRRAGGRRPHHLALRDAAAHPDLPAGPRGRQPRRARPRPALAGLRRARDGREGGLGVRRGGADDRRRGAALRPLRLGPLRPALHAARLPLRRHGESAPDLPDADPAGGGPLAGERRGPRAGPQLDRQPGDQRHHERLLAQRGLHRLRRAPHPRGAVRPRLRRPAGRDPPQRAAGRTSTASAPARRTRGCGPTSPASTPTRSTRWCPTRRAPSS